MFRLDIGSDQRGAGAVILIDLCLEVGGALDKGSGEVWIGGRLDEFEQRRRLARKISSAQHMDQPHLLPGQASRGNRWVRSTGGHLKMLMNQAMIKQVMGPRSLPSAVWL